MSINTNCIISDENTKLAEEMKVQANEYFKSEVHFLCSVGYAWVAVVYLIVY